MAAVTPAIGEVADVVLARAAAVEAASEHPIEAADVTLVRGDLTTVPTALRLSARTLRLAHKTARYGVGCVTKAVDGPGDGWTAAAGAGARRTRCRAARHLSGRLRRPNRRSGCRRTRRQHPALRVGGPDDIRVFANAHFLPSLPAALRTVAV